MLISENLTENLSSIIFRSTLIFAEAIGFSSKNNCWCSLGTVFRKESSLSRNKAKTKIIKSTKIKCLSVSKQFIGSPFTTNCPVQVVDN